MSLNTIAFRDITFSHAAAPTDLFNRLNVYFSEGFTGVIGPNGAGKTTLCTAHNAPIRNPGTL